MSLQSLRKEENWAIKYWRPAMCWQYFAVCLFDFMLAPIFIELFCYLTKTPFHIWHPITLEGGSVYHASMGAIIGISAWSRGQEKIAVIKNLPNGQSNSTEFTSTEESIKPVRRQGEDN